ncbi:phosphoglucosamine mutase, partial [Candidatus Marinimicrobia bacterium]|nr:phosphoglucosamine mutase [Candidatus Neomarinimicrobiota bacterium]
EYTLVLAVEGYINNKKEEEIFVTNLSSSMALNKLAEKHDCIIERSAVGEINVVQKMLALNSKLGGEGNGGVILKESHLGRDSLVGAAMVLNRMAQEETKISKIHSKLPQFFMVKDKIILDSIDKDLVEKKVKELFSDAEINSIDGLKLIWKDRWIHIRGSNTEPIMRIYAEASSKKEAEILVEQVKACL